YLIFEVRIMSTFFLITYWERNPERLRAGYYIIMYILLISFPLLIYYRVRMKYNYLIFRIGIIGGIIVRILCLVVHINLILCRMITSKMTFNDLK
ncbi:NU4M oxidoreductase, partial [Acromyrmex insinuator]